MFIVYDLLNLILLIFSPLIFLTRYFLGKEDKKDLKKNFACFQRRTIAKKQSGYMEQVLVKY